MDKNFLVGYFKKASELGVSQEQATALLKSASESPTSTQKLSSDETFVKYAEAFLQRANECGYSQEQGQALLKMAIDMAAPQGPQADPAAALAPQAPQGPQAGGAGGEMEAVMQLLQQNPQLMQQLMASQPDLFKSMPGQQPAPAAAGPQPAA